MPNRLVNGDLIGTSAALLRVHPVRYRAEFALLLTLAEANGVFECDAALIYQRLYARNRPDILGPVDVTDMLESYAKAMMLFRWDERGKTWGHWVKQDKPGRLPSPTRLKGKHEVGAPVELPTGKLNEWLANGQPMESAPQRGLGLGLGGGLGLGKEGAPGTNRPSLFDRVLFAFEGKYLRVTASQDEKLAEAFPWVDRPAEYRKMESYYEANPERRPRKASRAAHNWFNRIPPPREAGKGNGKVPMQETFDAAQLSEATARKIQERYAQREQLAPVAAKRSME